MSSPLSLQRSLSLTSSPVLWVLIFVTAFILAIFAPPQSTPIEIHVDDVDLKLSTALSAHLFFFFFSRVAEGSSKGLTGNRRSHLLFSPLVHNIDNIIAYRSAREVVV